MIVVALGLGYLAYNHHLNMQSRAIVSGIAVQLNATDTATPSSNTMADADITSTPVCFFNWAYDDVPEGDVTAIRSALDSAGYEDAVLETSAYGEDNICQVGDEIVSTKFLLMDITPKVQWEVDADTLNNPTELGRIIRDITTTLLDIPDVPRIAYIEIDFVSGENNQFWRASNQDITITFTDELDDDALYGIGVNED